MKQTTVIGVNQELNWHIAHLLLENFDALGITYSDKQFAKLLSAVKKYVNKKIDVPFENLGDSYVIVENDGEQKSFPYGKPLCITAEDIIK